MKFQRTRTVLIEGLRLDAALGVHDHEKGRRQPVEIDVTVTTPDKPFDDDLGRVVDYEAIVNRIRMITAEDHVNLVETLAARIADTILENDDALAVDVRLVKLTAIDECRGVGVRLQRRREPSETEPSEN